MEKKKSSTRSVLGDNPFGDLSVIDIPEKPGRKAAKREKRKTAAGKPGARSRATPQQAISEAERKIDEVLRTMSTGDKASGDSKDILVDFASRMQTRMAAIQVEAGEERRALATIIKIIRPSFYLRKVAPLLMACRGVETDEFGMDETLEKNLKPVVKLLFDKYFRVHVEGIENIPASRGCIVVANHAPVLSLDGIMIRHAIETQVRHDVRWLMENELFYIPYAGTLGQRIGGVRASQENASHLLSKDFLIITFPEGVQGISSRYRERYNLKRFGRGGYIRIAVQHSVPIVPAAITGPQDSFPILWKVTAGADRLSLPFIPVTPLFPLLGPLGLLPLPTRWKIKFGAPFKFDYAKNARPDQTRINKLDNSVRDSIQAMIDELRSR
jgi:1-acyl-sn-glycerol-3-phosphate acyltransferase